MNSQGQDSEGLLSPVLATWRLRVVARHIEPGDRVLDCGCGSGRLLRFMPDDCRYVGVDIVNAFPSLEEEHVRFMRADVNSETDLQPIAAEGPFDVIVMAALLEHFADPGEVLARLRSLLSPQGSFVVTTPHPIIRRFHEMGARIGLFSRHGADEHNELLDREDLERICSKCGFEITIYRTFQLGANQLCVLRSTSNSEI